MASISYVVNAVDSASDTFKRIALSADDLNAKLDEIGRKNETARVALAGDKDAELKIDKLDLKMANLAKKVAEGKIGVEGQARAMLQIRELELKLDELSHKRVTATVDVNVNQGGILGRLKSLFGGGGGGLAGVAGGEGGSGLSALTSGGLTSPVGIAALVAGGVGVASLVPGVIGLGLGGGAGLAAITGGTMGAAQGNKILKADQANITHITSQLKTAIGQQKQQLSAALQDANKQYAKDSAFYAPFIAFQQSLKGLAQDFLKPLQPIMKPLVGIIGEFGKGIAGLGPQFTALFQASLPFIKQFTVLMLQSGKILLPAFTQALNQMVKSGALKEMTQGLVYVVQGLAGFVKALGPGMKFSADIFKGTMEVIGKAINLLGYLFTGIAIQVDLKAKSIVGFVEAMRRDIPAAFDRLRHDVAAIWNSIWQNTIGVLIRGYFTINNWMNKIPGMVEHAVSGVGTWMYNFGKNALTMVWHGAESVVSSVTGFFSGFAHGIVSVFKKIWGWFSPSATMYEGGKSLMEGLFLGIKDHAHKAQGIAAKVAGGITGAFSGSVLGEQRYARGLFSRFGWSGGQLGPLIALWNRESGWNPLAMNPSSGAFGIAQALGHGLAGTAGRYGNQYPSVAANNGNAGAQIAWGLSYIASQYGSPAAAWAHEMAFGWYDRGGWLQPGLTLAMNNTGRPERVIGPDGGGGNTYNITVQVAPGGNLAEAGRQTVAAIREFEKRAGKSWRS